LPDALASLAGLDEEGEKSFGLTTINSLYPAEESRLQLNAACDTFTERKRYAMSWAKKCSPQSLPNFTCDFCLWPGPPFLAVAKIPSPFQG
jgi:hypothetical protein